MTTPLIPHGEASGTDFCGGILSYIVRSDLGCYMTSETWDLHKGEEKKKIYPLHPNCSEGDHYMASMARREEFRHYMASVEFFIIKGNEFRRVTDLTTDKSATTGTLHKKCQGGDFYLAAFADSPPLKGLWAQMGPWGIRKSDFLIPEVEYTIIFAENWKCVVVSDLRTAEGAREYELHDNCKGGLYYWSDTRFMGQVQTSYYYLLKPDRWGIQFHYTTNLCTDSNAGNLSFHPSVTNFLPGGMAVTMGRVFGVWELVKAIENRHRTVPIHWKQSIERKSGYKKQALHSVQHNWNLSASSSIEASAGVTAEKIFEVSCKQQFSYSELYGGQVVDTTQEDWSEEHTVKEDIDVTIPPGESVYIWQYKLAFKKGQDALYCKQLQHTGSSVRPTSIPLPSTAGQ